MKNLWPLIAQERGVEIGEEFMYCSAKYKIATNGSLIMFSESSEQWVTCDAFGLTCFIYGEGEITKLSRPYKQGDSYYCVSISGRICATVWTGNTSDASLAVMGNRFRTRAEALEHMQEILDKYAEALK